MKKNEFRQLIKSCNNILERLNKQMDEKIGDINAPEKELERLQNEMNLTINSLTQIYKDYYNRKNIYLNVVARYK